MTLEESKEVIPMMEAMIAQIEEQQNIMAEMLQEIQEKDEKLMCFQEKEERLQQLESELSELSYNKLCLNVQTHECLLDGEPVSLTPTEFSILHVLLSSAGNVVSIEELFHAVWKDEYYSKNSSTITVHIRHLREKLNDTSDTPQYIKTIWGVGYKI